MRSELCFCSGHFHERCRVEACCEVQSVQNYRDQLLAIASLYTNIIYLLVTTLHYPSNYTSAFSLFTIPMSELFSGQILL